jgi:hypothetical protein
MFYAANPNEELTSIDISVKFDVPIESLFTRLRPGVRIGLFAHRSAGPGPGKYAVYSAGPEILMMCGNASQRAELAAANEPVIVTEEATGNMRWAEASGIIAN